MIKNWMLDANIGSEFLYTLNVIIVKLQSNEKGNIQNVSRLKFVVYRLF
jgi:hypothetical protein